MASLAIKLLALYQHGSESLNSRPETSGMRRVSKKCWGYIIHCGQSPAEARSFILTFRENSAREKCGESVGGASAIVAGIRHRVRLLARSMAVRKKIAGPCPSSVMQGAEIKSEHEEIRGFEAGINALCVFACCERKRPAPNERDQSQARFQLPRACCGNGLLAHPTVLPRPAPP